MQDKSFDIWWSWYSEIYHQTFIEREAAFVYAPFPTPVAQQAEQSTSNRPVEGSTPSRGAKE